MARSMEALSRKKTIRKFDEKTRIFHSPGGKLVGLVVSKWNRITINEIAAAMSKHAIASIAKNTRFVFKSVRIKKISY